MSSLVTLADDAFLPILSMIGLDAMTLMLTGQRTLMARISRQCRHLGIHLKNRNLKPFRLWPNLLSSLPHLNELSIRVHRIKMTKEDMLCQLRSLPSTLEVLELCYDGAPQIPLLGSIRDFSPPKVTVIDYWHIGETFPTLKKLVLVDRIPKKLSFKSGDVHPRVSANSPEFFNLFPSTLEHLDWNVRLVFKECETLLTGLPSSLKYLKFGSKVLSDSLILQLPPHLTELYGLVPKSLPYFGKLPRSLTDGDWTWTANFWFTADSFRDFIALIPPSVQSLVNLRITLLDDQSTSLQCATLLPKSLTYIRFMFTELVWDDIQYLPRSITRLSSVNLSHTSMRVLKGPNTAPPPWPPNLTSMDFPVGNGLLAEQLWLLPRTLKALTGLSVPNRTDVNPSIADLPPHLTILKALFHTDILLSAKFPSSITKLTLYSSQLSPTVLQCLPPRLRVLELPHTSLESQSEASMIAHIPSTVKKLEFCNLHCDALSVLPSSLSSLWVKSVIGEITDDIIPKLPSGITQINVVSQDSSNIKTQNPIFTNIPF